ncbi:MULTISPECIES: hypothetical protein [unclassified Streptomyces]|uniref:hypothetical protein n=1 Tax=unclassified Streptomyces TaxID=2593676 RepID=UPI00225496BA|nr:hypothetical protein [Streptomyces sp. NBC_01264]MCX4783893.1 hypothetical protein [Streptomyces sp. NBC_01264]
MAQYSVPLTTAANTAVIVETDETDPDKIAALAVEVAEAERELCRQCGDEVDLGDDWRPVLIDSTPTMTKLT